MSDTPSTQNYYFVPLGREPGGLLDLLGLPPTATEKEVSSRVAQYNSDLDEEYLARRKLPRAQLDYVLLKARLSDGEISQQQFEAELEEIVESQLGEEIRAKLKYDEARAQYEAGQLTERKFQARMKNILAPIGGKELVFKRRDGQLSQEEFDAEYAALLSRLEAVAATPEEMRAQRDAVVADLEGSEITQEEFDRLDQAWQDERTEKKKHLNKLRESYNAMLARKRECATQGFAYDDAVWLEQHAPSPDGRSRSLSRAGSGLGAVSWGCDAAPVADKLWATIDSTDRVFWRDKVLGWADEVSQLGPELSAERAGGQRSKVAPLFPSLCEPFPLLIDRLQSEEVEDISTRPERAGERRAIDLDLVLARLLADLARRTPKEEAEPAAARRATRRRVEAPSSQNERERAAEDFLRFLKALAEAERKS